jgi:hypothetical protein
MRSQRLARLFLPILLILSCASLALAESTAPVPWAPVQAGFTDRAENVLPYHPTRLLVKFTEQGFASSQLPRLASEKGVAAPGAETGLASVDAIGRELGVVRVSRATIAPANRALADRLGTHRVYLFELDGKADIPAAAARLAADPNV